MIRYHDVDQLTTAKLERVKLELDANLNLIAQHLPIHAGASRLGLSQQPSERSGGPLAGYPMAFCISMTAIGQAVRPMPA